MILFRYLMPLLLAICSRCWGQTITLPEKVEGGVSAFISVAATTDGETVKWKALDAGLNVFPADLLKSTKTTVVSAPKAGRYRLMAYTAKDNVPSDPAETVVVVGTPGPDPTPPGPVPPGPTPPDPPSPAPIPEPGFRVMILYETEMKEQLPLLQKAVLFGTEVRDYLDKTCVKEPDGGNGYRIYDKDQDASGDYPVWKNAMERKPTSIPWVIISNGKTGFEGPLPESPSKFLELCKKYEVK